MTCFYAVAGGGGGKGSLILFNLLGAMCQWVNLGLQSHRLGGVPYLESMRGRSRCLLALECGQTGPPSPPTKGSEIGPDLLLS